MSGKLKTVPCCGCFGHISFEYKIPKNSSKPCFRGKNSGASPKCHLPNIPVA